MSGLVNVLDSDYLVAEKGPENSANRVNLTVDPSKIFDPSHNRKKSGDKIDHMDAYYKIFNSIDEEVAKVTEVTKQVVKPIITEAQNHSVTEHRKGRKRPRIVYEGVSIVTFNKVLPNGGRLAKEKYKLSNPKYVKKRRTKKQMEEIELMQPVKVRSWD